MAYYIFYDIKKKLRYPLSPFERKVLKRLGEYITTPIMIVLTSV